MKLSMTQLIVLLLILLKVSPALAESQNEMGLYNFCIPTLYGCVERSNGAVAGSLSFAAQSSISVGSLVTLRPDGTVEYGKGYTPDAAAKVFWDAVGVARKARNCQ